MRMHCSYFASAEVVVLMKPELACRALRVGVQGHADRFATDLIDSRNTLVRQQMNVPAEPLVRASLSEAERKH